MIRILAALIILSAPAWAVNRQARGWCELGGQQALTSGLPSTTRVQASYPNCTVNVYNAGTLNHATIFSDASNTPLGNPFTASAQGYWFFYAADGCYDITLSGGTPNPYPSAFTIYDYCLNSSGGGGGGGTCSAITGVPNFVPYSATPTFNLGIGNLQVMTLSGTVNTVFLTGIIPYCQYQFLLCQDGAGGHTFPWTLEVLGAMGVGIVQNSCSLQNFIAPDSTHLSATGPGLINVRP